MSGLFVQALFGTPNAAEFVPGMIWLCLPFFVNVRVLDGLKDDLFDNVNHIIAVQWLTGVWCVFNVILDLPHKRFKTCCWVPGCFHVVEVFGTIGGCQGTVLVQEELPALEVYGVSRAVVEAVVFPLFLVGVTKKQ